MNFAVTIFICPLIPFNIEKRMWSFMLAASTHDQEVFSFHPDERFCNGFEEVLTRYRELVPQLRLAGYHLTGPFYVYRLVICLKLSHTDLGIFGCRANIICSDNWNGDHCCWAKWRPVPRTCNNSWWTGIHSVLYCDPFWKAFRASSVILQRNMVFSISDSAS